MKIKIHGFMFKPVEEKQSLETWRVYGTRKTFNYSDGRLAPLPASWQLVTEFKIKHARGGKVGFPTFELEPTHSDGWQFYNLVPLDADGREVWHDDNELTLPENLPDEFDGRLDVAGWLLWNLEDRGLIAPGQLND